MHRAILSLSGFVVAAGLGACFIESPQPSTFRFACESDDDCGEGDVCDDGLCQQACGGADAPQCPDGAPLCLNGYCSSTCPVDEEVCPSPQACMVLYDDPEDDEAAIAVCAIACDDQDHPCAEGQLCVEGICLTTCTTDDECGNGESCLANVCIPSFGQ